MTKVCGGTTAVALALLVAMLAGCSREKIDWKSAEAADTVESYDRFLSRHPDGALAALARARVAQLNEDRDWKRASAVDTADAYRQFLSHHGGGKWSEEARVRIESFALDGVAAAPRPGTFGPRADTAPTASSASTPIPAEQTVPYEPAKSGTAAVGPPTPPASTKPAAITPAAAAANAVSAPFGIQLGAFRSQEAALNDWKRLQVKFDSHLHGLFPRAVPVEQSGGTLFRLQAPVGEESRARAICASLAKQSQPCVVVLPRPH